MNRLKIGKNEILKILFLTSFWVGAILLYIFLEMSIESLAAHLYGFQEYNYHLGRVITIALPFTVAGSLFLGSFEVLYFNKALRKKSLGVSLAIKAVFYLLSIFFLTTFATMLSFSYIVDEPFFHNKVINRIGVYLLSPKVWVVNIYWGIMIMAAIFILQIGEKFGRGVLLNFFLGKYRRPKEEVRIFMFLDLSSSATYAEKLGHIKYSRLIQDCFFDLSDVVANFNAHIYQYVGDEVVLTWDKKSCSEKNNCIDAFFEYRRVIKNKSDYYNRKYDLIPEFKAGMHFGDVTIAEVGELKKELAYHGDAINTAARIRSFCGEYNKKLVISSDLLSILTNIDDKYKIESMGVRQLKGKENVVALFSVEEK
jgi:adenylate cyclase